MTLRGDLGKVQPLGNGEDDDGGLPSWSTEST
jgi:hypothetical protein